MKYLPFIVAILLVLAACAQEAKEESKAKEIADQLKEQANETQPVEEVKEETEQPKEEPKAPEEKLTEVKEEVKEEITSVPQQRTRMYKFLDAFAKITGYDFTFKRNHYYVKGTRYKIILDNERTVKGATFGELKKSLYYYDTVYVDRAQKTAMAYCEGNKGPVNKQCSELEIYDLAYPVQFDEYNILLPEDWLFAYLNKEPALIEENKYYINGRATVYTKFEEIPSVELNIDPGTGLVLRADKKSGSQLVERNDYEQISANTVRDVDVRHRTRNEIPTSETFYR